jgi:hypothetical protein
MLGFNTSAKVLIAQRNILLVDFPRRKCVIDCSGLDFHDRRAVGTAPTVFDGR